MVYLIDDLKFIILDLYRKEFSTDKILEVLRVLNISIEEDTLMNYLANWGEISDEPVKLFSMQDLVLEKESILASVEGGSTTQEIADYYEVEVITIESLIDFWRREPERPPVLRRTKIKSSSELFCKICKTVSLYDFDYKAGSLSHDVCLELIEILYTMQAPRPDILIGILAYFNQSGVIPRFGDPNLELFTSQFEEEFEIKDYFELITYLIEHYDEFASQVEMRPLEKLQDTFDAYQNVLKKYD